jgi:hypothetical protein
MAFTVDIRGNASHLEKTLGLAKNRITELGNVSVKATAGLAALGAAGAAGLGAFVISSSKAASNVESLTMQFETLLGGADAAGKRMEEITKFAASTPFEIAELASTSKLLQTLGGDLLATGDGLRMVGDAAAISGQPIAEVGLHIGRVFNAITSGTSAGESVARLQELGLMSGTVKRQFEDLAAAQKKGDAQTLTSAQALAKLKEVFASTDGAMLRLAATTESKLSNLNDNITKLKVAFGTGFNSGLRDALDATNNFLPQIEGKFRDVGNVVGDAISSAIAGDPEKLATIGAYAGTIFVEGFKAIFLKGMDEILATVQDRLNVEALDPLGLDRFGAMITGESSIKAPEKTESASMSGYIQTALENVANSEAGQRMNQMNLAQQVKYALENGGVKEGMSAAVRQGVFDAWKQQEAQRKSGAKFTN